MTVNPSGLDPIQVKKTHSGAVQLTYHFLISAYAPGNTPRNTLIGLWATTRARAIE